MKFFVNHSSDYVQVILGKKDNFIETLQLQTSHGETCELRDEDITSISVLL